MANGNSSAARSARVKLQLRDKKGRWIEMGRGAKWYSSADGKEFAGTVVGSKGNNAIIALTQNAQAGQPLKTVEVHMKDLEMIGEKATLMSPEIKQLVADTVKSLTGKELKQYNARNDAITKGKAAQAKGNLPETSPASDKNDVEDFIEVDDEDETDTSTTPQKAEYLASANVIAFGIKNKHGAVTVLASEAKIGDKILPINMVTLPSVSQSPYDKIKTHSSVNVSKSSAAGVGTVESVDGTSITVKDSKGTKHTIAKNKAVLIATPEVTDAISKAAQNEQATMYKGKNYPHKWAIELDQFQEEAGETASGPIDTSKWKKVGQQMGSNAGGTYETPDGDKYYVKKPSTENHAKNEVLADKFYAEAGIRTSDLKLAEIDGQLGTASKMINASNESFYNKVGSDAEYRKKVHEGFAVDAWLANWDVVGLEYDNIITDKDTNEPVRVDPGGSLLFRAMGSPKGDAFGPSVGEFNSMRFGSNTASNVFGSMTDEEAAKSVNKVRAFDDAKIDELVDSMDFEAGIAEHLKSNLKARRDDLISKADAILPPPNDADFKAMPEEIAAPEQTAMPEEIAEDNAINPVDSAPAGARFAGENGDYLVKKLDGSWNQYNKANIPIEKGMSPQDAKDIVSGYGYEPAPSPSIAESGLKEDNFILNKDMSYHKKDGSYSYAPNTVGWSKVDQKTGEKSPAKYLDIKEDILGDPDSFNVDVGEKVTSDILTSDVINSLLSDEDKAKLEDKEFISDYITASSAFEKFPGYSLAQIDAIQKYVNDSDEFNSYLRGKGGSSKNKAAGIAAMDEIFDASPLTEDVKVYRGIRMTEERLAGVLNSKMYTDLGYSSTSDDEDVATNWADVNYASEDRTPFVLEMELPKGFKAHKIDYNALGLFDDFGEEQEVVLPRNLSFDIIDVQEYTSDNGNKYYKATATPILTEQNYIGDDVDGIESTEESTGGQESEGQDDTGQDNSGLGSDSDSDTGGSSTDEGEVTSPEGETNKEKEVVDSIAKDKEGILDVTSQGAQFLLGGKSYEPAKINIAEVKEYLDAVKNNPNFKFPNKGKQVTSNGNTFEANSNVVSPKYGKGIVSVVLPSTNSAKVLYGEHGYKVTQAKNLTPAETILTDTDESSASFDTSAMSVGDTGTNPTNGKKYIIGKGNKALSVGDSVEYTKQGTTQTGKISGIYAGTESAKVTWPDGTASTKKVSQLVGLDASESTDNTPTAPATQEDSSDEPTELTEPYPAEGLTVDDLNNFETGKQIGGSNGNTFVKKASGTWDFKDSLNGSLYGTNNTPEGLLDNYINNSDGNYQVLPDLHQFDEPEPEETSSEPDLETMPAVGLTEEDFAKFPAGTKITNPIDPEWGMKDDDSSWTWYSSENNVSGEYLSDYIIADDDNYNKNGIITLPSGMSARDYINTGEDESELETLDASDLTEEEFAKLPEGTKITSTQHDQFGIKQGDGTWLWYWDESDSNPVTFGNKIVSGDDSYNKYATLTLPEGEYASNYEHVEGSEDEQNDDDVPAISISDLEEMPLETVINDPSGVSFKKTLENEWESLATSTLYTDEELQDFLHEGYTVELPEETTEDAQPELEYNVSDLPVGTFVPMRNNSGTGFRKTEDNSWSMEVSGKPIGNVVDDKFVQAAYDVNKPEINVPEQTNTSAPYSAENLTLEELTDFPVGTKISRESEFNFPLIFIKKADNNWSYQSLITGEIADNSNPDSYILAKVTKVNSGFEVLPDLHVFEDANSIEKEQSEVSTKKVAPYLTKNITLEEVNSLPVGTQIMSTDNPNMTMGFIKFSDTEWRYKSLSGDVIKDEHYTNSYVQSFVSGPDSSNFSVLAELYTPPTPTPKELLANWEAELLGSPYSAQNLTLSDIENFEIGKQLADNFGYSFIKKEDNKWSWKTPAGTVWDNNNTNQYIHDTVTDSGKTYNVMPDLHVFDTATTSETESEPETTSTITMPVSSMTEAEFMNLSPGTKISSPSSGSYGYKKDSDGNGWDWYFDGTYTPVSLSHYGVYSDDTYNKDAVVEVPSNATNIEAPVETPTPAPASPTTGTVDDSFPYSYGADLPVGTKLINKTFNKATYTKVGPNEWTSDKIGTTYEDINFNMLLNMKDGSFAYELPASESSTEDDAIPVSAILNQDHPINTPEDVPVGSTLELAKNATSYYKKVGANVWQSLSKDDKVLAGNLINSDFSGVFTLKNGNWKLTLPEEGVTPKIPKIGPIDSSFPFNHPNDVPVGTKIFTGAKKAYWTKTSADNWNKTYISTGNVYDDIDVDGSLGKIFTDKTGNYSYELSEETSVPAVSTTYKSSELPMPFADVPVGSKIKGTNNYTKTGPNAWNADGSEITIADSQFNTLFTPPFSNSWSMIIPADIVIESAEPKTYSIEEAKAFGIGAASEAPVGTYINLYGNKEYVKLADNLWKATDHAGKVEGSSDLKDSNFESIMNGNDSDWTLTVPESTVADTGPKTYKVPDSPIQKAKDLPIGTIIVGNGTTYTKKADNDWGTDESNLNLSDTNIQHVFNATYYKNYDVTIPGETPVVNAKPIKTTIAESGFTNSVDVPIGTKVHHPNTPSNDYIKQGDNLWKFSGSGNTHSDEDINTVFVADYYKSWIIETPAVTEQKEVIYQPDGTSLFDIDKDKFDALPVGTKVDFALGTSLKGKYEKKSPSTWQYTLVGQENPSAKNINNNSFHVLYESDYDKGQAAYSISNENAAPAVDVDTPAPTHTFTGINTFELTTDTIASYPVGTVIKGESPYGNSYYITKEEDGTWTNWKKNAATLGKKVGIKNNFLKGAQGVTSSITVMTPESSTYFHAGTGELSYIGDEVTYLGGSTKYTVAKILKGGINLKDADGNVLKAKPKDIVKTSNFGYKQPTNSNASGNATAPITEESKAYSEKKEAEQFLTNFAGAKAEDYNSYGVTVKAAKPKMYPIEVQSSGEADINHPLYKTPEPNKPVEPSTQMFSEALPANLPKWDSDAWLTKVKQRYLENPNKAKSKLEESNKWGTVQSVISEDNFKTNLKGLLDSKYLDQALFDEATEKYNATQEANKPLIEEHKKNVAKAKKEHEAKQKQAKDAYKEALDQYNKDLKAWTDANPNPDAIKLPVLPEFSTENFKGGDADWDKAHVGTYTANTAIAAVKADNTVGTKGLSIATDSDQIEDLDVNVRKMLNESGDSILEYRFKLTGAFGKYFESKMKTDSNVNKKNGAKILGFKKDPATGLIKESGQSTYSTSGTTYEYKDPETGAKIEFTRSAEDSSTLQNGVRITMPIGADSSHLEKALANMEINAKPATEGDIMVYAENRFIATFAGYNDGNKNLTGKERTDALKKIKEKYDITTDDIVYTTKSDGRVKPLLNDSAVDKLMAYTKVSAWTHSLSNDSADNLFEMIAGPNPGLLSTYQRWQSGINQSGMSSQADLKNDGGDSIFTHIQHGSLNYNGIIIDPRAALRRLDIYANDDDNYGAFSKSVKPIYDMFKGNPHETLFRHGVPISEWRGLAISSYTRTELIERLKKAGILKINGVPIEEFIVTSANQLPALTNSIVGTDVIE